MKKKNILFMLLMLLLIIPTSINAKSNYKFETDLTIEEDYKSSVFMFSQELETKENTFIDGIALLFSGKSTLDGKVDYLANVAEETRIRGTVNKDSFVLGSKIVISGELKRDLYAFGDTVFLTNKVGGSVKIYANKVKLENIVIERNVTINASTIEFGDNVEIKGKLHYNDNALVKNIEKAKVSGVSTYEVSAYKQSIGSVIMTQIKSIFSYLLVAILLMYMCPKLFNKMDEEKVNGRNFGIGALVFLLVPFLSVTLIITPFGMGLGMITIVAYIIFAYLSQIVIAYLGGKYIHESIMKNKENKYLSLIIGIVLIKLLSLLSIFGMLIVVFASFYGMGFFTLRIFDKK